MKLKHIALIGSLFPILFKGSADAERPEEPADHREKS